MSNGRSYDPHAVESEIYAFWEEGGYFHAEPDPGKTPYVIDIPLPNVTGALHLGHALNNTLQDILIRHKRMCGYEAMWMPGTDHAGIATQAVVERKLKEEQNLSRHELGREGLVEKIWEWKEQYGGQILKQLRKMGFSCDWARTRFTLDEVCAKAVYEVFFRWFKEGLIYRGMRLVNWDAHLQTAVADDEVIYETVQSHFWHYRYPIEGRDASKPDAKFGEDYLVIATTRPETMLGDTAVAVHPDDDRYKHLVGKNCILPLMDRPIPIIADGQLAKMEMGTGCVKVTPGHDPKDYDCGLRNNLKMINILTPDGRINENGGPYEGMDRYEARQKVVEDLKRLGLMEKIEDYETEVGHSDRSKTPIEPMLSEQWFIKMGALAELAMDAVRDGRVQFFPKRYEKTYLDWLGEKRDWCISRQLWWGHRIPVWTVHAGAGGDATTLGEREQVLHDRIVELLDTLFELGQVPRTDYFVQRDFGKLAVCARTQTASELLSAVEEWCARVFRLPPEHKDGQPFPRTDTAFPTLPQAEPVLIQLFTVNAAIWQDPDVLDTWFSSALWPFSTLHWPDANRDLEYFYPTSTLVTARGIITLWVARMVMTGLYFTGRVPFQHVHIHPVILDGQGRIMSKSLGNGVDPLDIIELYGTDALRFTMAQMDTETQDVRLPVKPVKMPDGREVNSSEKFELGRNFCNKIWQAATGFVLPNLEGYAPRPLTAKDLALEDHWILSRLAAAVAESDRRLERYQISEVANTLYAFFWSEFCDWYVELVKPRLFGRNAAGEMVRHEDASARAAQQVSVWVLDQSLRLLHPIMPFITEALWKKLNEAAPQRGTARLIDAEPALIAAAWPDAAAWSREAEVEAEMEALQNVIRGLRDTLAWINTTRAAAKTPAIGKLPRAFIRADAQLAAGLQEQEQVICRLGRCEAVEIGAEVAKPAESATKVFPGTEVFVPIGGLADLEVERKRLSKERDQVAGHIKRVEGKLANEGFVAKAPPAVVERERARLGELQEKLAAIERNLGEISS